MKMPLYQCVDAGAASRPLKPVMVWIHGVANVTGSGNENGERLMRHVLVSFNYRMALFGFFAHPPLAAETPDHSAGNYGLMDQIAALTCVQQNIKQFGGDSTNVISGESATAIDSNLLMRSPSEKGLFKRIICGSGTLLVENGGQSLSAAEQFGVKLAEAAKLPSADEALKALRSAPIEQLLAAFAQGESIWSSQTTGRWRLRTCESRSAKSMPRIGEAHGRSGGALSCYLDRRD